ncbi:CidA/LrgA family protein [Sutterella sp.]|uniref:CidA/LrgA family protein n=1 Tax=Sutterella sp. TaxID=1981025 RepID=UPI0026E01939|nr:CidA/LrgA family protein [Sutterella sp.]MDO5532395.1 CidA/LrgA family protein [Sutterella sp.]
MLASIAIVLGYQIVGELISRLTGIPVPGPVIGMTLLLLSFFVKDDLVEKVIPSANALLANLSLLFVPAGVGIIRHGQRFMNEGVGIMIALIASTIIAMLVTGWTIMLVEKLMKIEEED